jgi:hypothetical protein
MTRKSCCLAIDAVCAWNVPVKSCCTSRHCGDCARGCGRRVGALLTHPETRLQVPQWRAGAAAGGLCTATQLRCVWLHDDEQHARKVAVQAMPVVTASLMRLDMPRAAPHSW